MLRGWKAVGGEGVCVSFFFISSCFALLSCFVALALALELMEEEKLAFDMTLMTFLLHFLST